MTAAHEWDLWSTRARLVVTDPAALDGALALVNGLLDEVDLAASRFRPDSEIRSLRPGPDGTTTVSPMLASLLTEALAVARRTDGAVDPTVGAALAVARLRPRHPARRGRPAPGRRGAPGSRMEPAPAAGQHPDPARGDRARPRRDRQGRGRRPCGGPGRGAARHGRPGQPRRRHRDRRHRPRPAAGRSGCRTPTRTRPPTSRCPRGSAARHVQHGAPHLAARRPDDPPHRRPGHRAPRPAALAQRDGRRGQLQRGQRRRPPRRSSRAAAGSPGSSHQGLPARLVDREGRVHHCGGWPEEVAA